MTKPMIRIHDVTTDEVIDREMTDDEFEAYKKQQKLDLAELSQLQELEMLKEAAQAKLAALGLTADDLKALGL